MFLNFVTIKVKCSMKFSGFKLFKCITDLRFLIWSRFRAHLFVKKDDELYNILNNISYNITAI